MMSSNNNPIIAPGNAAMTIFTHNNIVLCWCAFEFYDQGNNLLKNNTMTAMIDPS